MLGKLHFNIIDTAGIRETQDVIEQEGIKRSHEEAQKADIILLDEATSSLDPISSRTIEELFVSLKDKYTIVLVTHTLRQAKRIADYVAFMYMGQLIEFGTADQVFNHPREKLTKEYIDGGFS